eukprot:TRINITY_DN48008_c0_g1_i1.p1 TRINITY_DN48008_c0_g1~~TRINITY_DN48008_c0_g1_i1.p1  ORF type:complete len:253 (-),score=29.72 TRINITY_DN48008_c0_g1_i1:114-872(-)
MYPRTHLLLVACCFVKSFGVRRLSSESFALDTQSHIADSADIPEKKSRMGRLDIYEDEHSEAHNAVFNESVHQRKHSQLELLMPSTHTNTSLVAQQMQVTKAVSWLQLHQKDWKDNMGWFVITCLFLALIGAAVFIVYLWRKSSPETRLTSTSTQTGTSKTNDSEPPSDSSSSGSDSDADPVEALTSVQTAGGHRRNSKDLVRGAKSELRNSLLRRHSDSGSPTGSPTQAQKAPGGMEAAKEAKRPSSSAAK